MEAQYPVGTVMYPLARRRGERAMTKEELVNHVAATTDLPRSQAATVVNLFVQCITEALVQGDKVEVRGFGSFRLRHRRARAARNPRTGALVQIPAKRVPWFTPGKALRALVNAQAGAPVES
jgi:integration host factor subunit beta